jgi:hypothetical protein
MLYLLATEPPSVGRHNEDVACRQTRKPREKNLVHDWISPGDWSSYIVIGSSSMWWYKDHIPLIYFFGKLVAINSLV